MTLPMAPEKAPLSRPVPVLRGRSSRPIWWAVGLAVVFCVVSLVRVSTDAVNLTSVGAIQSAIIAAMPIALAGLAGIWSERAGVVNIGLEGMMVLGTFGCGAAGYQWGPWVGVLVGVMSGLIGGLILGLAAITFGVDHIIAGVAISIVAPGLALYLAQLWFGGQQTPSVRNVTQITIPGLSDWLGTIAGKGWFLVSDLAGVLGGIVTQLSVLTVLAAVLIVVSGFLLWRTRFGLRLRSCGEAPYAAESLGVNVYFYKYIAVMVSGAMAGLGGAFLVVGSYFQNGQTAGRGYIGLASVIFGNYRPGGMAAGALLFGYTDGVHLFDSSTGKAMHAFLMLVALAALAYGVWQLRQGARGVAVATFIVAALALVWFFTTSTLPSSLVTAAPHTITLLVMALASQRLRPPKADGMPYRKGSH